MSHRLIGISAPRARLSRWNNPAAGGYLFLGTDARRRHQLVRKNIALAPGAYTLESSVQGERESPAARDCRLCAGAIVPVATSTFDPLRDSDLVRRHLHFTVTSSCSVVLLAFEARPTERPVEAQFANLSLNSGAADVPVNADDTGGEDMSSLARMSRRG
jgi:hypothetical protein